jgi:hypothetical protein
LRLSHSSSMRRRRSSGLRSPMFRAGLLINLNMPRLQFLCYRSPVIPLPNAQG